MAVQPEDLLPNSFKIKIKGTEYTSKPPKLAHRIILMKVQPLFAAIAGVAENKEIEISSEKILEYQRDLDVLFADLIPDMKDVTLDEIDLVELLDQLLENSMPQESKELKDAKVEVKTDPKARKTG